MDKCGICRKPAVQLFETGKEGVYACFKCQPLVPEITIEDHDDDEQSEQVEEVETIEITEETEETSEISSLECNICNKVFPKSGQLQTHLRNHRAARRFVCTYCNKAFSQSNNLRAHLRIHTNERPYKCSECGKAFTQVTNLNNHVRLHTGERPFVCPEPGCDKAYAQVTNLNQHRKRHLSGRPLESSYSCSVCGQLFQQRNHMYSHRRTAHPELKSAPRRGRPARNDDQQNDVSSEFVCVLASCGASLGSASELADHLLNSHRMDKPRQVRPVKEKEEQDPLEIKEPEIPRIKILSGVTLQHFPKLKVQRMFQ